MLRIGLIACESDDKKLRRLQGEQLTSCLVAQSESTKVAKLGLAVDPDDSNLVASVDARTRGDTAEASRLRELRLAKAKAAGFDTLAEKWLAANRRCELATRELNRFMR